MVPNYLHEMHLVMNSTGESSPVGNFSVLMSVYVKSTPRFLDCAIRSVTSKQTLIPGQICLVIDGPIGPALSEVIQKWSKLLGDAFTLIALRKNVGLANALNIGIKYCRYELIARMDCDDVSLPQRFWIQYHFLLNNPKVDIVGSQVEECDDNLSTVLSVRRVPLLHSDLVNFAKLRSPFNHPSVMFRKSAVLAVGGYPICFPEDYPLWVNMIKNGSRLANLDNVLLRMRSSSAFKYRRGGAFFFQELQVINYFYRIGFLNAFEYIKSVACRICYRLSPSIIKIFVKSKILK